MSRYLVSSPSRPSFSPDRAFAFFQCGWRCLASSLRTIKSPPVHFFSELAPQFWPAFFPSRCFIPSLRDLTAVLVIIFHGPGFKKLNHFSSFFKVPSGFRCSFWLPFLPPGVDETNPAGLLIRFIFPGNFVTPWFPSAGAIRWGVYPTSDTAAPLFSPPVSGCFFPFESPLADFSIVSALLLRHDYFFFRFRFSQ